MHVTLRGRRDLPSLRSRRVFDAVRASISAASSARFRVVQFSVQRDHVHLVVEASDREAVMSGAKGLAVRIARAVNHCLARRGSVWADRYHARELRTPREVRNALAYVLLNWRKHERGARGIDGCSSGPWFNGWRAPSPPGRQTPPPVAPGQTWLVTLGWRRHGLLRLDESPG